MQPKNIRRKTLQDETELLKRNQNQKTKEDKKYSSNTDTPQIEYPSKLIDKDYLKMIRNMNQDIHQLKVL